MHKLSSFYRDDLNIKGEPTLVRLLMDSSKRDSSMQIFKQSALRSNKKVLVKVPGFKACTPESVCAV